MVAGGTFWSGWRQSRFNAAITQKNETIQQLQTENIRIIKGSDHCFFQIITNVTNENGFRLTAVNGNDLPVYDVFIRILKDADRPLNTPEQQNQYIKDTNNPDIYDLGNIPPNSVRETGIFLPFG